ncbi:hypothetical protein PML95_10085 (plasmid) [Vagococcus lutrae]|uniref:Uncharacterized protein n=1 Tax=Vagococcus lutrae TaxID=81947 RepID=A0AAE9XK10_9ENTE|nr:hypothetical protein [Vagococcus lutrae]MDO5741787.1 hypothetical protein [Vagococcus sp.]MCO7151755.1 hypothetical protein [Vagococcus lutrae]UQF24204.1 hypothetical protein M2909_04245 [Vagococcus lutrae]UQF37742.1 hypothetical protein M2904_06335 [Vagococcus lutrae]UQF63705.1 hypothetical protein M2908_07465 [Vagococcus lutrae]
MVDEFWTGKQIYIETNEDGFVIGYSSNEISNNDFIMNSEDVPENFFDSPFLYRVSDNEIVFDDSKVKLETEREKEEQERLEQTPSDKERIEMLEQTILELLMKKGS